MKRKWIVFLGGCLVLPLTVLVFPQLSFVGPVSMILGFMMAILLGWRTSLRQSKYGIFAEWFETSKFIKMELNRDEINQLKIAGVIF